MRSCQNVDNQFRITSYIRNMLYSIYLSTEVIPVPKPERYKFFLELGDINLIFLLQCKNVAKLHVQSSPSTLSCEICKAYT